MESLHIIQSPQQQIAELEDLVRETKKKIGELRKKLNPKEITDYTLLDLNGKEVLLSALFGDKNELLLIFNMGKSCRWCTLWADGFNGLTNHLESRAAFVLLSPDKPEIAKQFSQSRNWKFRVISDFNSTLRNDAGLRDSKSITPAAASFTKDENGSIRMHSSAVFGPGDNYCVQYDLMDLLPGSSEHWEPQYQY